MSSLTDMSALLQPTIIIIIIIVYSLSGLVPQMEPQEGDAEVASTNHYCLVAIGRLQVTSTPNCADLGGAGTPNEFISRHSIDGKFTFVDQR